MHDDLKDKLVTSNLYSNTGLKQAQEVVREVQMVVDTLVSGNRTITPREKHMGKRMATETVRKATNHFSSLLMTVRSIKRGLIFTTWLSTKLRKMAAASSSNNSLVVPNSIFWKGNKGRCMFVYLSSPSQITTLYLHMGTSGCEGVEWSGVEQAFLDQWWFDQELSPSPNRRSVVFRENVALEATRDKWDQQWFREQNIDSEEFYAQRRAENAKTQGIDGKSSRQGYMARLLGQTSDQSLVKSTEANLQNKFSAVLKHFVDETFDKLVEVLTVLKSWDKTLQSIGSTLDALLGNITHFTHERGGHANDSSKVGAMKLRDSLSEQVDEMEGTNQLLLQALQVSPTTVLRIGTSLKLTFSFIRSNSTRSGLQRTFTERTGASLLTLQRKFLSAKHYYCTDSTQSSSGSSPRR